MKKLVLSAAAVLCSAGLFAQSSLGYGIKAGVNFPSYSYGNSNDLSDTKSSTNFSITGYLDAPITRNFTVQPGVSLQGKGAKLNVVNLGDNTFTEKQNTMWLEVPVNFVAKLPTGESGNFYIGAGPYVAFGLSGKNKYEYSGSNSSSPRSSEVDFKFGKDETLKGTDFGLNFIAGYHLTSGLSINGGYGLGLTNIAGAKARSTDIKNRVWTVVIGFAL